MTDHSGYAGKILRIDLSSGSTSAVPTGDYVDRFIGGRGIATKIFWDEVPPHIKPFDPGNKLIIMTGPLGGLPGMSGSRWLMFGKSPAVTPEGFCYANFGGHWGAHLKFAGYDGLIVQGKSDKPVYLLIQDGRAEIRDASHLWGRSAVETRETLKRDLGDSARVLATGPAGDNLVVFATVLAENDSSGSSGFGAVMGSKKLKAIVVRGTGKIGVANPGELHELTRIAAQLNRGRQAVPMYTYARIPGVRERVYACHGCICGCARTMAETPDGRKSKRYCHSGSFYQERVREYYGDYNEAVIQANRLCNEYGVDTRAIDAFTVWLSRCRDAGILDDRNIGIPISKIGSLEFIETLVRKTALREGFGEVLAQGPGRAAQTLGGKAVELLPEYTSTSQAKALGFDPRNYITAGILYATEPRRPVWQLNEIGALMAHWVGWALTRTTPIESYKLGQPHPLAHRLLIDNLDELKATMEGCYVSSDVIREIGRTYWGSEAAADFSTYEGKALAAKKIQDRSYAKECLVLCMITWPMLHSPQKAGRVGDPTLESRLLSAVTGTRVSPGELDLVGERVFNLQRAIHMREGRKGKEADRIPDFCFDEPVASEAYNPGCLVPGKDGAIVSRKGARLDRAQFQSMMDEYYALRGWDPATGLQTKAKLEELGLGEVTG